MGVIGKQKGLLCRKKGISRGERGEGGRQGGTGRERETNKVHMKMP